MCTVRERWAEWKGDVPPAGGAREGKTLGTPFDREATAGGEQQCGACMPLGGPWRVGGQDA